MVEVFVLTIFKLPKMDKREVQTVIQDQFLCRIAFHGKEYPYIAPFQYTLMDNSLYFHFTNYGKKIRLLKRDNRVCVEIEKYNPDLSEYRFVVMRGKLRVVTDSEERKRAIKKMAQEGKRKLSTNFLSAHGFNQDQSWSSFSNEKPIVIVKLEDVKHVIGLKNP
jgi:nitroimidazol reductase NimA-like FMN-containing flavoprotein (pyridoxamine 5'-phosphate oxidase superfamily)